MCCNDRRAFQLNHIKHGLTNFYFLEKDGLSHSRTKQVVEFDGPSLLIHSKFFFLFRLQHQFCSTILGRRYVGLLVPVITICVNKWDLISELDKPSPNYQPTLIQAIRTLVERTSHHLSPIFSWTKFKQKTFFLFFFRFNLKSKSVNAIITNLYFPIFHFLFKDKLIDGIN